MLNTFVVSASVTNASSPVKDLDEHVKVMLQHLTPNTVRSVALQSPVGDGHSGSRCCQCQPLTHE